MANPFNPDDWAETIAMIEAGKDSGWLRQCSIGWHDECSVRRGYIDSGCACPCHTLTAEGYKELREEGLI